MARRPQPAVTHIVTAATKTIKTLLHLLIHYKNTQNCPDCQKSVIFEVWKKSRSETAFIVQINGETEVPVRI